MVRRNRSWLYLFLVVLLIGVMSLAACDSGDETTTTGAPGQDTTATTGAEGEKTPGGIAVEYIDEPSFIDPVNAQESEGVEVVSQVFDSLVALDPVTAELVPGAAESWETNDDASVWTFKLRQGAKFHNGREVVAQDFKYALERVADPASKSEIAYHLDAIKGAKEVMDGTTKEISGIRVVDDYTLEITLNSPWADFGPVMAHPGFGPVPKEEVDKDPAAFAEQPVGNGPFMMDGPWQHDQLIKVVRFDDYVGDKALLDGVNFQIFKDEETAFLEFKAGNVDFTHIPPGQIAATTAEFGESDDGYTAAPGKQVLIGKEMATYFVGINVKIPPMDNPDVRRALSLAINREAINETVYEGIREIATGIVPPNAPGAQPDGFPYAKYDVEQAKQLLAKAGFPDGQGIPTLTLGVNSGAGHEEPMQLVQADLKAIGVNVELEATEFAQYLDARDAGKWPIYRAGWIADYPTEDNFLYPLFHTGSADNDSFYSNPEVDKALDEARQITDDQERYAALANVEKMIGEDAPLIPLVYYAHRDVVSARVNGFVYDPVGIGHWESAWISE
jgi:ABC-type transport system substrate-binding protein